MFYDKQIKYLDVYEGEEKLQNGGFVRLEAREDTVDVQLRIQNLHNTDNGPVQVKLVGADKEAVLGEVLLERGRGMLEWKGLQLQDMAGGIGYEKLEGVWLKLNGERVLKAVIREGKQQEAEEEVQEMLPVEAEVSQTAVSLLERLREQALAEPEPIPLPTAPMPEEQPEPLPMPEEEPEPMPMPIQAAPIPEKEPEPVPIPEEKPEPLPLPTPPIPEEQPEPLPMPEPKPMPIPAPQGESIKAKSPEGYIPLFRPTPMPPIQERLTGTTKWQQLSNLYPHIRPFEDERDYLKIKPEDFVILVKKYYPLITNSFLKHGYYNYEHLILVREMRKDGEHYYIGVPGNFYEKEKQVAVLFGFESFEGKTEPARNGDFGYYMISVEI